MSCLFVRHLAILCTSLFALIVTTGAIPNPSVQAPPMFDSLDRGHVRQLPSYRLQHRDLIRPATTEISPDHPSGIDDRTSETSLAKRQRRQEPNLQHIRVATMFLLWSGTRLNSLVNPNPGPDSNIIRSLKNMYSQIRQAAISQWAKLPQQSYLRIVCGELIFILLPPEDRTVPWTLVEEVAYTLLLLVSAGLGGLVTGFYPAMATSGVVWFYLAVIAPVARGQLGGSSTNGVQAPYLGTR